LKLGSQSRCATGLRYAPTEAKRFDLLEFFDLTRKGRCERIRNEIRRNGTVRRKKLAIELAMEFAREQMFSRFPGAGGRFTVTPSRS
jgi:hypothetical protein